MIPPHSSGWTGPRRRFVANALAAFTFVWGSAALPSVARGAQPKLDIVEVKWPGGAEESKARDKQVRQAVKRLAFKASLGLDFGDRKAIVTFLVKDLSFVEERDVVRVSCTLVGRLKGGGSARSHITFGGDPAKRKKLEKQVLAMVTEGVMTRLAQIAKDKQREREAKKRRTSNDESNDED